MKNRLTFEYEADNLRRLLQEERQENARLRDALEKAAKSLEAIQKGQWEDVWDIKAYAETRMQKARAALEDS